MSIYVWCECVCVLAKGWLCRGRHNIPVNFGRRRCRRRRRLTLCYYSICRAVSLLSLPFLLFLFSRSASCFDCHYLLRACVCVWERDCHCTLLLAAILAVVVCRPKMRLNSKVATWDEFFFPALFHSLSLSLLLSFSVSFGRSADWRFHPAAVMATHTHTHTHTRGAILLPTLCVVCF